MKKISGFIKLQIPAGKANPAPPIGPSLGQRGLNILKFCKMFNEQTKSMELGISVSVVITVFDDKSFTFIFKTPPTSSLLKKAVKIEKGSSKPNLNFVANIEYSVIKDIALTKFPDLTANNLNSAIKTIIGSAKSMGIVVKNNGDLK